MPSVLDYFKRIQTKASSVTELIVSLTGPNKPIYTPRNYEALARESFTANVYVYRAVMTLAHAASGVPWKLFREGKKLTEVEQHPLLDLMRRPNPLEGGTYFWAKVFMYLYLSGNSYIEAVMPQSRNSSALELWTLRPDRMRVMLDAKNWIGGYVYTVNGRQKAIEADLCLHWKLPNPVDDIYGLSPIAVASKVIDQMNAANDWNTALLQNYARPPGALVTPKSLEPNQRDTLRDDMKKRWRGVQNAGVPLLLENGMTWLNLATSPADMDWLKGKVANAREIAMGIGVPPELLGDSANKTYSNVQEARKALYSEAVLPRLYELRDGLNNWLPAFYDDALRLDVDTSGIEALQEDIATKRSFVMDAWQKSLIMLNEARKELGFDELDDGNVFWIPSTGSLVPEDQLIDDGEDDEPFGPLPPYTIPLPLPAPQDGGDQPAQQVDDLTEGYGKSYRRSVQLWLPRSIATTERKSRALKAAHWSVIDAQRSRWYPEVSKHVADILRDQRGTVATAIKNAQDVHDIASRVKHAVKAYDDDMRDILTAIYLHVGQPFAKQTYTALARKYKSRMKKAKKGYFSDDDFDASDTILDYLSDYAGQKVTGISDTILDQLQTILTQEVASGSSIADIADAIDSLYLARIIPNRSEVIARTEVIGASNLGSRSGALITGLDLTHSWLATNDARTRESHSDADGQTVPLDEPYAVGGSTLMYPGDAGGDVSEIVNCRCTETYELAA